MATAGTTLPSMLLIDVTDSARSGALTGVQRVVRHLVDALQSLAPVTAVVHDSRHGWRTLTPREAARLQPADDRTPSTRRGTSAARRLLERLPRRSPPAPPPPRDASALLLPEIPSTTVLEAAFDLRRSLQVPTAALFYDAIPLRLPDLSPPGTVARFPGYLSTLRRLDGIAAISAASAADLLGFWQWSDSGGAPRPSPPVTVLPLAVALPAAARPPTPTPQAPNDLPRILCISTIEGRKNHLALLDAASDLWSSGARFHLHLIGLGRPETARPALRRIRDLTRAGHPLLWSGPVTDQALATAYASCMFTVYPSLHEGYGLPIAESLAAGRPCVCGTAGALAEVASGGGCLTVDTRDPSALRNAIRSMLEDAPRLAALAADARARRFPSWSDSGRHLLSWLGSLTRRG